MNTFKSLHIILNAIMKHDIIMFFFPIIIIFIITIMVSKWFSCFNSKKNVEFKETIEDIIEDVMEDAVDKVNEFAEDTLEHITVEVKDIVDI